MSGMCQSQLLGRWFRKRAPFLAEHLPPVRGAGKKRVTSRHLLDREVLDPVLVALYAVVGYQSAALRTSAKGSRVPRTTGGGTSPLPTSSDDLAAAVEILGS